MKSDNKQKIDSYIKDLLLSTEALSSSASCAAAVIKSCVSPASFEIIWV